ncbi:hypothetical protein LEMLEM_LOCUS20466 [Lemmus lemmus]
MTSRTWVMLWKSGRIQVLLPASTQEFTNIYNSRSRRPNTLVGLQGHQNPIKRTSPP